MSKQYLAFDLGAESGRAVLGTYDGSRLGIEELHRFPNEPVLVNGELQWDILRLWHEIQRGLRAAANGGLEQLDGIGVDTWGVDFALLGEDGTLLSNPVHYRDKRTDGIMHSVFDKVPADRIYAETGIQFMQLNTLFQFYAAARRTPKLVAAAEHLLTVPDLLNYWLTGVMATEFTNATTTQMYNPVRKDWARGMLDQLGLPSAILKQVIQPGETLGSLREELRFGLRCAEVIAPACHDTGSAVAAIALTPATLYISSGTWSLMGAEVPEPIITGEARQLNFTNEGGVAGTIRLLKNIMGMWLLQGCRRQWEAEGRQYDYGTLVGMARMEPVLSAVIDPDDPSLLHPVDMTAAIRALCSRSGQAVPEEPGDYVQIILESLALKYRFVADALQRLTGTQYTDIRVVGGGSRNRLLNQFTADATGCQVTAGPVEATALGNVAMQMVGTRAVRDVADARELIDRSFPTETFEPRSSKRWDLAYDRLLDLSGQSRPV